MSLPSPRPGRVRALGGVLVCLLLPAALASSPATAAAADATTLPEVRATDATVSIGVGVGATAVVPLERTGDVSDALEVAWSTRDVSAVAGTD